MDGENLTVKETNYIYGPIQYVEYTITDTDGLSTSAAYEYAYAQHKIPSGTPYTLYILNDVNFNGSTLYLGAISTTNYYTVVDPYGGGGVA